MTPDSAVNNSAVKNPEGWPSQQSQPTTSAPINIGPLQIAAFLIGGGGLAVLLSAALPWVSALGGVSVDIVVVLAFFGLLKVDSGVVGDVVSPGIGFYLALLGLLSSIVGTVTQQIAKPKTTSVPAAPTPAARVTGEPVMATPRSTSDPALIPARQPQSPDGHYWWDGTAWVAYQ